MASRASRIFAMGSSRIENCMTRHAPTITSGIQRGKAMRPRTHRNPSTRRRKLSKRYPCLAMPRPDLETTGAPSVGLQLSAVLLLLVTHTFFLNQYPHFVNPNITSRVYTTLAIIDDGTHPSTVPSSDTATPGTRPGTGDVTTPTRPRDFPSHWFPSPGFSGTRAFRRPT